MEKLPDWATRTLGKNGHDRIEEAIARAESQTSGEIVPLLVRRSSTVGHVPMLAMSLLMLSAFMLDLPAWLSEWRGSEPIWIVVLLLAAAALGYGLSRLDAVDRLLTPRPDQMRQVDLRAQIEFYELGMSQTDARTGVLLMVSLMEHRAVVLADHGISEKLDATIWQEVVDLMIDGVKGGDLAGGMCAAIERCGALLAPHFPIAADDANELRDHLVVKE
ncbi:MAG: TPM domain-containing protein [Myxococcales bacterium]|nr:TPM domain-containing protein [Myxococcales bacterium]